MQTVRDAIAAAAAALATPSGEVSVVLTDDAAIASSTATGAASTSRPMCCRFRPPKPVQARADFSATSSSPMKRSPANAPMKTRPFLHHLAHLTVHGFLHLIGYDHQNDSDADEMEGIERKIMAVMKMPDPYRARDLGEA